MAGDPTWLVPYQWKPGQTGNPSGHSKQRRAARRLREALDTVLGEQVPEWLLSRLPPELLEDLPPGISFAELLALRLVWAATTATTPGTIISAAQLVSSMQSKADALAPPAAHGPPILEPSDERRREVAAQLGIDLEALEPDSTNELH
jgi:hypothetical protein